MNLLKVDLTTREAKWETLSSDYLRFLGGKGIATKLLLDLLPPKVDAFSAENLLIFATGPLNGIALSGASRLTCHFKSPLTNGYGESQCGGYIAHEFKKAGLDILLIKGKASSPAYILVENGKVSIEDASHLWGKDAFETEEILKEKHGGEILAIGQAGENLVRFACINHRKGRQFGRGGAGAVMGSKRLKAIVVKGSKENLPKPADPERLKQFRRWLNESVKKTHTSMTKYGTPGIMSLTNEANVLPTRYWQKGSFDEVEKINAEALAKYVVKSTACFACSVACGKLVKAGDVELEGPEYETLFALGSLCENSNLEDLIKAAELCDRFAMDTITAGNAIAYWMALGKAEFGDSAKIIELIEKIAFRRDEGDLLAEGVKRVSESLSADKEPIHVKGMELAGYDPRGLFGMALAYATSPRGACHMRSCAYRPNLVGAIDRFSVEGQAELVKDLEDFYAVVDSMVFCRFLCLPIIGPIYWKELAKLYEIVAGKAMPVEKLRKLGEEIVNLAREFNLREGVKQDTLPKAFLKAIGEENFRAMIEEYYRLRGWPVVE
ncbi:MAG: aldehyde ferredoxin oxidoreductase family protein [Archaeoglobus sp.]|nr:aldehyde ferredoxin oxidoreductase family protein [Archaeoglobus sp.]